MLSFEDTSELGAHDCVGLRIEQSNNGQYTVGSILAGGPASKSGVALRDELISVDGHPVQPGEPKETVRGRMHGQPGTVVTLSFHRQCGLVVDFGALCVDKIEHGGKQFSVKLIRGFLPQQRLVAAGWLTPANVTTPCATCACLESKFSLAVAPSGVLLASEVVGSSMWMKDAAAIGDCSDQAHLLFKKLGLLAPHKTAPDTLAEAIKLIDILLEEREREREDFHAKITMRLLLRDLAIAFYAWKDNVTQQRRARMIMQRVCGHWTYRNISGAFGRWAASTEKQAYSRNLLRQIAFKLALQNQARVVSFWRRRTNDHIKQRMLCSRQGRRWMNICLGLAIGIWRAHSTQRKKSKAAEMKITGYMLHRALVTAFVSWQVRPRQQRRTKMVCNRVVFRILRLTSFTAMKTWREHVSAQRRARDVFTHFCVRCQMRSLFCTFQSWLLMSRSQKKSHVLLSRALVKMLHQFLVVIFKSWHKIVKRGKCSIAKALRFLKRRLQKKHFSSFERWRAHVAEMQLRKNSVFRDLGWVSMDMLGLSLDEWTKFVARQKQMRAKAILKLEKYMKITLTTYVLREWHNRSRAQRWAEDMLTCFLLRMLQRALSRIFLTWTLNARADQHEAQRKQAFSCKAAALRMRRTVSLNFDRWRESVRERNAGHGMTTQRFNIRPQQRAIDFWKERIDSNKHCVATMILLVRRWQHQQLSKAFYLWVGHSVSNNAPIARPDCSNLSCPLSPSGLAENCPSQWSACPDACSDSLQSLKKVHDTDDSHFHLQEQTETPLTPVKDRVYGGEIHADSAPLNPRTLDFESPLHWLHQLPRDKRTHRAAIPCSNEFEAPPIDLLAALSLGLRDFVTGSGVSGVGDDTT